VLLYDDLVGVVTSSRDKDSSHTIRSTVAENPLYILPIFYILHGPLPKFHSGCAALADSGAVKCYRCIQPRVMLNYAGEYCEYGN